MELHVAKDPMQLSENLAEWISEYIKQVLERQDRFTFVLSGGSTPKILYKLLASSPYLETIPWQKIHFFWGDERVVPYEDDRNNAKMAYDELLSKTSALPENIHIMRTDIDPVASAEEYEKILNNYFAGQPTTFDLVLLGMGDDGHTLSLFPGTEVIDETSKWATAFFLDSQDIYRITLTAPIVNKAATVVFLAAGASKASVLKKVLEGERDIHQYPSQIIQPSKGRLHWFVDEAAIAQLN
jgi:6-phosphogluconolactonase